MPRVSARMLNGGILNPLNRQALHIQGRGRRVTVALVWPPECPVMSDEEGTAVPWEMTF